LRTVVWLVLLFVVAVVAASSLGSNDGLVSLYWGGWRADLSLNFFVLLVLGACFLILTASRAMAALVALPQRAREWRALQRERAAQRALREAQLEFFAARYARAARAAERAVAIAEEARTWPEAGEVRALAQLLAAASAHRLQDRPRRDNRLKQAQDQAAAGLPRVVGEGAQLLCAEWALDDRNADAALQMIEALPAGVARRTQALRLKLQAARLARRPMEALRTARLLAKHQAFTADAALGLVRSLAGEALDAAHDADQLRRAWAALEPAERADPRIASRAARRAVTFEAGATARAWLAPLWDRMAEMPADDRAAVALALAAAAEGVEVPWLARVDKALATWPADPAVAAAAGAVLVQRQLWGKARGPLEQAAAASLLEPQARRSAWQRLAELARHEGDESRAARCERAAAGLA